LTCTKNLSKIMLPRNAGGASYDVLHAVMTGECHPSLKMERIANL
jgi:hypothetical protein